MEWSQDQVKYSSESLLSAFIVSKSVECNQKPLSNKNHPLLWSKNDPTSSSTFGNFVIWTWVWNGIGTWLGKGFIRSIFVCFYCFKECQIRSGDGMKNTTCSPWKDSIYTWTDDGECKMTYPHDQVTFSSESFLNDFVISKSGKFYQEVICNISSQSVNKCFGPIKVRVSRV